VKVIVYLALILMMSAQPKEKNTMSYQQQIRARQNAVNNAAAERARQPAWASSNRGRSAGVTPQTQTSGGGSWWEQLADKFKTKMNELGTPTGIGGGNSITPNFNTPSSIENSQYKRMAAPAWLGGSNRPTGSFFSGGQARGVQAQTRQTRPGIFTPISGTDQPASRFNPRGIQPRANNEPDSESPSLPIINPNEPTIPTGSFIAADGGAVRNAGNAAYWMPQGLPAYPTGTFFAGGGSQVAGPATNTQNGFGTSYGWGGGGGGYGGRGGYGGGGYGGGGYNQWPEDMGLFQWNYKG
jgi:hypothetical protein